MPILTAPPGNYALTPKEPAALVAGNWYYGWNCTTCARPVAVFDDPSAGKTPVPIIGEGAVGVFTCPGCATRQTHAFEALKHFPHTQPANPPR